MPALVLAPSAALGSFHVVQPTYRAEAQLLLLPSATASGVQGQAGNPYLNLTGGLGQTAQVIAVAATDAKAQEKLAAQGASANYTVSATVGVNAPVVVVDATSAVPAAAQKTLQLVVAEVRSVLLSAQQAAGAPANMLITAATLTQTDQPKRITKTQIRASLVAGIGVFILALVPFFVVERASFRRTRRGKAVPDSVGPLDEGTPFDERTVESWSASAKESSRLAASTLTRPGDPAS
jgi:hypothetical protein